MVKQRKLVKRNCGEGGEAEPMKLRGRLVLAGPWSCLVSALPEATFLCSLMRIL